MLTCIPDVSSKEDVAGIRRGSILSLSITGVVLWTQLSRKRLAGAAVIGKVLVLGLALVWQSM